MPKRIIILDTPDNHLAALGEAFMEASGGECTLNWVHTVERLQEKLRTGLEWDILVLDCVLGDGAVRVWSCCRRFGGNGRSCRLWWWPSRGMWK